MIWHPRHLLSVLCKKNSIETSSLCPTIPQRNVVILSGTALGKSLYPADETVPLREAPGCVKEHGRVGAVGRAHADKDLLTVMASKESLHSAEARPLPSWSRTWQLLTNVTTYFLNPLGEVTFVTPGGQTYLGKFNLRHSSASYLQVRECVISLCNIVLTASVYCHCCNLSVIGATRAALLDTLFPL